MAVTLHVCITCRAGRPVVEGELRAGERLHAALRGIAPEGVRLAPVSCLSACSKGCAVALAAPGRWTYVYGGITPESDAAEVAAGAARYAGAPDGIVPWRERPDLFRRNIVARIPPLES